MRVLESPNTVFASSALVQLEVLPKAIAFKQGDEAAFYQAFFDEVSVWATVDDELVASAFDEASRLGLSAVDALHLAAAKRIGADVFVTAEAPSKPLHMTNLVAVRTIRPNS